MLKRSERSFLIFLTQSFVYYGRYILLLCLLYSRYIKFGGMDIPFKDITTTNNNSSSGEEEKKSSTTTTTTSSYQFVWSTKGIDPSLNHHRTNVLCSIKFKNFKEIEFKFQVKFYAEQQIKQATWGQTLNNLDMECVAGRGTYSSYVVKLDFNWEWEFEKHSFFAMLKSTSISIVGFVGREIKMVRKLYNHKTVKKRAMFDFPVLLLSTLPRTMKARHKKTRKHFCYPNFI